MSEHRDTGEAGSRSARAARRGGAVALALGVVLCVACERREAVGPKPTQVKPAPAAEAQAEALAEGESRIEVADGRVTVRCRETPRGLLLEKLARELRFDLVGDLDARPTTLALDAQPLEAVVVAVLDDVAYGARWRYDAITRRHVLARLEVGEPGAAGSAAAGGDAAAKRREMAQALREKVRAMREKSASEEAKAELAERREEQARSQADLLEQLRSSNPDMRLEAVQDLDPEGPALPALTDLLANDADARVRAGVAEQLADSDGYAPMVALTRALDDPDPMVVEKVLGSLEFIGDETLVPELQRKCPGYADPKLRERCAEAIEFLQ